MSLKSSERSPLDFYLSFKRHFDGRLKTDAVTRIRSEMNLLTDDKAAVSLLRMPCTENLSGLEASPT